MSVVDSSGWLEYLAGGENAGFFAAAALEAVALMRQGKVIVLDERLALVAAEISLQERLPTADSIILATARAHEATLWTQDADFAGKRDVKYTASPR
ncbi:MAG: type II toxin-antitoxin system VapC family toxin [Planctomycetes bacterium]|nr:type II toxin-antitoxin system VapC family toxin [Planctomycetota bacterium]